MKYLRSAQQAQVKTYNDRRNFTHFKIKNKMRLFTKNFKNAKFKKKLFYKLIEFFQIKNVVELQTYGLRLFDQ